MNYFVTVFAICCIAVAQARPGGDYDFSSLALSGGGGSASGASGPAADSAPPTNFQLMAVPDDASFTGLNFPDLQIQDLGTMTEGEVPPESVKVTKTITVKIPQPYPVSVPHPVPVPYSVPKPVPVPVTKLVHVPKPYPVEVTKTVPVPIEVPSSHGGIGGSGSGGGFDQHGGYSQQVQIQQTPQKN
ncbi:hypothetical protein QE152_g25344 [Popillia japonica]|uniref:Uncharacterized protein n=1 Tax=Popillia japonica TaxID=7064 RepID=A0AAW1K356_POPJA